MYSHACCAFVCPSLQFRFSAQNTKRDRDRREQFGPTEDNMSSHFVLPDYVVEYIALLDKRPPPSPLKGIRPPPKSECGRDFVANNAGKAKAVSTRRGLVCATEVFGSPIVGLVLPFGEGERYVRVPVKLGDSHHASLCLTTAVPCHPSHLSILLLPCQPLTMLYHAVRPCHSSLCILVMPHQCLTMLHGALASLTVILATNMPESHCVRCCSSCCGSAAVTSCCNSCCASSINTAPSLTPRSCLQMTGTSTTGSCSSLRRSWLHTSMGRWTWPASCKNGRRPSMRGLLSHRSACPQQFRVRVARACPCGVP